MDPERFAVDWIAAWNAHDLDAIVAHYADDVELHSPLVARLTGDLAGVLYGKSAVRDYFARGLERFPDLRFTLRSVLGGAGSLAIEYESVDGLLASETMQFEGGLVVRVLAHYRTPAAAPAPVPNINDPVFDERREHPGYEARRARIGYQLGTARLGISLWELPAGQAAYPYHAHLAEEELVVVLEGALELRRPTGWSDLTAGDVVGFSVGSAGAHQLINCGAETARFLAISTNGQPDVVLYPDWGNVFAGERRPRGGGLRLFFHEADAVDYYDGATPPPQRPNDATTPWPVLVRAWETWRTREQKSTSTGLSEPGGRAALQLAPAHRAELVAILAAAGVDFARHRPVVFGSRAQGTARRYSDIDLGLAGEPLPFDQLGRLCEALDDSDLPYRVDVVNLAETSREFRALALAGAVALTDTPVT